MSYWALVSARHGTVESETEELGRRVIVSAQQVAVTAGVRAPQKTNMVSTRCSTVSCALRAPRLLPYSCNGTRASRARVEDL